MSEVDSEQPKDLALDGRELDWDNGCCVDEREGEPGICDMGSRETWVSRGW